MKLTIKTILDFERRTGKKLLGEGEIKLGIGEILGLAHIARKVDTPFDDWVESLEPEELGSIMSELTAQVQDFFRRMQGGMQARQQQTPGRPFGAL